MDVGRGEVAVVTGEIVEVEVEDSMEGEEVAEEVAEGSSSTSNGGVSSVDACL